MKDRGLILGSIAASVALVATYLALGGSSYAPASVRDPCKPRPWPHTTGLQDTVTQFTLSGLDGTACKLHVSRETLVLALATSAGRDHFASDPRLESAVRAGLVRAIDDGERAGAINPAVADALRQVARNAPVAQVVSLIRDASPIFGGIGGLLNGLRGFLPQSLQGLIP